MKLINQRMKLTVGTDDHWDIGGYVVLGSPESTQHKYRFFWTLNNADYSKRAMVPLLLDNLDFRSLISSLMRKNTYNLLHCKQLFQSNLRKLLLNIFHQCKFVLLSLYHPRNFCCIRNILQLTKILNSNN